MIYVFLADGFEEIEALTPVDYLRRAGIELKTVGVTGKTVTSSHKIPVISDITADEITFDDLDGIILPGGMPGTLNLEKSDAVQNAVDFCCKNNKLLAAICAAPSILGHKNILNGKNAVCFPGFENELKGAVLSDKFAVRDGNVITAKGAGAATEFAFEIIKYLSDENTALQVRNSVQTCY
ncbi:MAG: DJ-1/PfpI family protein [Clostridiales bacterium]|nr:DJ-1/PfpI family protein [Clostridiales bacterium]MCD7828409.1 DJ-1/PfpI family protein [Clostridiales bacterium]